MGGGIRFPLLIEVRFVYKGGKVGCGVLLRLREKAERDSSTQSFGE